MTLHSKLSVLILFVALTSYAAEAPSPAPKNNSSGGDTIEEVLQKLSTVPGVFSRRDPFGRIPAPYISLFQQEAGLPQSDLERYDLDKYVVTAVLLGDEYNRALVQLPPSGGKGASSSVVIVREHDRIGNLGGVIRKITNEGLLVEQSVRSGRKVVDRAVIKLPVGGIQNSAAPVGGPKK